MFTSPPINPAEHLSHERVDKQLLAFTFLKLKAVILIVDHVYIHFSTVFGVVLLENRNMKPR